MSNKKYYSVEHSAGRDVGNVCPQIEKVGGDLALDMRGILQPDFLWDKFYEKDPNLNHFIMVSRAKLTDLISCAPIDLGKIVSLKIKEIIENSCAIRHRFYPCVIKKKVQFIENYFWFHYIDLYLFPENCLYEQSTFSIIEDIFSQEKNEKTVSIHSFDELKQIRQQLTYISKLKPVKVYFPKEFMKYDFFTLTHFYNADVISERLYQEFLDKKVTGCEFVEIDWIDFI